MLRFAILLAGLAGCGATPAPPDANACRNVAIQFSGAQYLEAADAIDLEPSPPTTFEVWLRVDATPQTDMDVFAHYRFDQLTNQAEGWRLSVKSDRQVAYVWYETILHTHAMVGGALDSSWTHIAAVVPSAGFSHLYVNGRAVAESAFNLPLDYVGTLRIGTSNTGTLGFVGAIDEARLSHAVRYDADFDPPTAFEVDADTVALWHFDEGQGDVASDATGRHPAMFPVDPAARPSWIATPCGDQL